MLDRYDASTSRPLSVSPNRWERGQRRRGEGSWSIRPRYHVSTQFAGAKFTEVSTWCAAYSALARSAALKVRVCVRTAPTRAPPVSKKGGTSNCAKVERSVDRQGGPINRVVRRAQGPVRRHRDAQRSIEIPKKMRM